MKISESTLSNLCKTNSNTLVRSATSWWSSKSSKCKNKRKRSRLRSRIWQLNLPLKRMMNHKSLLLRRRSSSLWLKTKMSSPMLDRLDLNNNTNKATRIRVCLFISSSKFSKGNQLQIINQYKISNSKILICLINHEEDLLPICRDMDRMDNPSKDKFNNSLTTWRHRHQISKTMDTELSNRIMVIRLNRPLPLLSLLTYLQNKKKRSSTLTIGTKNWNVKSIDWTLSLYRSKKWNKVCAISTCKISTKNESATIITSNITSSLNTQTRVLEKI